MARRPKAEAQARAAQTSAKNAGKGRASAEAEVTAAQEIDRIIARLDVEIPEAQKRMDALLARLRATHSAA
jgi:hypothetical protein